jgi:hypothetical protein
MNLASHASTTRPAVMAAFLGLLLAGLSGCVNPTPHRQVLPASRSTDAVSRIESGFMVEGTVDGQPATFWFDTGAAHLYIYRPSAERLGLRLPSNRPDRPYWTRGRHRVELWGVSRRQWLAVTELPEFLTVREDGLVGWHTIRGNIVLFDAANERIAFLPRVPEEARGWIRLRVRGDYGELVLDAGPGLILVDTGIWSGVGLPPDRWTDWRAEPQDGRITVIAGFTLHSGLVVREQGWADQLTLGPLELDGVMVEEDNGVGKMILGDSHLATWGMAALRRVRMIVDGSRGVAYILPLHGLAPTPDHNRLGAVFVPDDTEEDGWIAHVAEGSPAFEAGIRDGDVLLRSGDHNYSGWRATPVEVSVSGRPDPPPGTEVELTLRRGQHV